MSLSKQAKERLIIALADQKTGEELAKAIEEGQEAKAELDEGGGGGGGAPVAEITNDIPEDAQNGSIWIQRTSTFVVPTSITGSGSFNTDGDDTASVDFATMGAVTEQQLVDLFGPAVKYKLSAQIVVYLVGSATPGITVQSGGYSDDNAGVLLTYENGVSTVLDAVNALNTFFNTNAGVTPFSVTNPSEETEILANISEYNLNPVGFTAERYQLRFAADDYVFGINYPGNISGIVEPLP
jgi:hypothetical protein